MALIGERRSAPCRCGSVAAWTLAIAAVSGCVSADKYRTAPDDAPRPVLFNVRFVPARPNATLNAVIVLGGPGSWKLEALWDEYMITIRNSSDEPLTITSATLLDLAGNAREPGTDPWRLEQLSQQLVREYDLAGIAFAKEGASAALYVGGIAGGAALFATTVSTSGVTVTVLQGPLALITVPTYIVGRTIENHDGRADIESEFHERRLKLPLKLAPGRTQLGSFFFPMVPNPRLLRLHWTSGHEEGDAEVSLEFLRGLHTPAKRSPTRM